MAELIYKKSCMWKNVIFPFNSFLWYSTPTVIGSIMWKPSGHMQMICSLLWHRLMKHVHYWRLLRCFLILLIMSLWLFLSAQLSSLNCHKCSKWSQRCLQFCVIHFHMCIFLWDAVGPVDTCTILNAFFVQIVLCTDTVQGSFLEVKGQTVSKNVAPEVRSLNLGGMVVYKW